MSALQLLKNLSSETVESLRAAIDATKADGAAAYEQIERLRADRLSVESFEALQEIDREIAKRQFAIMKIDQKIAELNARHASVEAQAREALRTKLQKKIGPAMAAFFQSAGATAETFKAILEIKNELANAGFDADAQALVLPPHINGSVVCNPELLKRAEQDFARGAREPSKLAATPGTVASRPRPAQPERARLQPHATPRETAPPLPDELGPLADDEVRARTLVGDYPGSEGRNSQRGRIVKVKRAVAQRAVENSKIEIMQVGPAEALRPMTQLDAPSTDIVVRSTPKERT